MKVVAFNGSPRAGGNTEIMLREVLGVLEAQGIETELVHIGGKAIRGCIACYQCFERKDHRCAIDDEMNGYYAKMRQADGILIGTPTYFADVSTEVKALIDRCGLLAIANDRELDRRLGAAVVAVRRAGSIHAFNSINHFFLINQMIVPGSCYWNMGIGRGVGEVRDDEEGMRTMRVLGENMAWLLKKLQA